MNWLEISVRTNTEIAEAISEVFNRYGSGGAIIEERPDHPDRETAVTVKAYIDRDDAALRTQVEQALWHLQQIYPFEEPTVAEIEEQDWSTAWRQDYTVQHIGEHIVIIPSWLDYAPAQDDITITIDPGMAFGTGLHPSTRLCLIGLEQTALEGHSLLDVGAGSGILSIYAAKMGAAPVIALEIDPVAVETARENARLNQVQEIVNAFEGSIKPGGYDLAKPEADEPASGPFDIIAINILAEVIAELSPALVSHLRPGGVIIAAGIIQERQNVVQSAWDEVGLEIIGHRQEGDWISLVGTTGRG